MRLFWMFLALIAAPLAASGQPVRAPHVLPGETWTYQVTVEGRGGWRQTREELTAVRAYPSKIVLSRKAAGSDMPPTEVMVGGDWSRVRSVNGRETVVNRPFAFPLNPGKSWKVEYTEQHPNRFHISEHWEHTYRVVGLEDVTVPAGTFRALKVEADGIWQAESAPALTSAGGTRLDASGATTILQTQRTAPGIVSGRTYKAFWYVPAVKRWVKSVEEYYDSNGVRSEAYTYELESYGVGP